VGIFTIVAVFVIAAVWAVKTKEDFYDTFPLTVSGMILLLYVLAFAGALRVIDGIAAVLLGVVFFYCILCIKRGDKSRISDTVKVLCSAKSILLLAAMVLITLLAKDKIALWWDDINYWAVDAKALYYNNGFAGKYGNVAPEFGDYPPAIQLFKWFFLHLAPDFKEGLMFGAYYCMNLIYTLPLLAKLKTNNPLVTALGLTGLFLIPGIIDGMAAEGTCADVTMGLVYGAFLWAAYNSKGHTQAFYFVRMSLYLCVLVLTKSVGIEWAFFGFVFFLLIYGMRLKEQGLSLKKAIKPVVLLGGACVLTEGSWLLFCLVNRRVAKLTGAGVKIALSGDFTLPDNTMTKMGHFLRGFASYPMHMWETWAVDLSSLEMLILLLVTVVVFYAIRIFPQKEFVRILCFVILTALAAYGIIFLGHLTIFAGELQYLDDAVMARSIARYGAPFAVGLLYLLLGILISWKRSAFVYTACLLFVVLTTSWPGAYDALYGYRMTLQEDESGRADMIESNARLFMDKAAAIREETTDREIFEKRVLYLRDDHTVHWVKDTYISYQASPVPVVYGGIATDTMTQEDMIRSIRESHAGYLYADRVEGDPAALFAGMTDGEDFAYETFYEIMEENGSLKLVKIQ